MLELSKTLGVIFWPLLTCSTLAFMICLERVIFYIKVWRNRENTYENLASSLRKHDSQPKTVRDEVLNLALRELQQSYYSGLGLLRTIGILSPAFGLLGTILGVIKAFQAIAAHTGPVTPNIIAAGLWEAMLTTSFGLSISLPCILMSYLFRSLGEHQLNKFCLQLNKLSLSFELKKKRMSPSKLQAQTKIENPKELELVI